MSANDWRDAEFDALKTRVGTLEELVKLLSNRVDILVRAHPKIDYGREPDPADEYAATFDRRCRP